MSTDNLGKYIVRQYTDCKKTIMFSTVFRAPLLPPSSKVAILWPFLLGQLPHLPGTIRQSNIVEGERGR